MKAIILDDEIFYLVYHSFAKFQTCLYFFQLLEFRFITEKIKKWSPNLLGYSEIHFFKLKFRRIGTTHLYFYLGKNEFKTSSFEFCKK